MKDKSLNISMRDVFISGLEKLAKKDKKIILIVNDQGAPSLDSFKKNLPKQFYNAGISEQNIIGAASGLSIKGFKPYIYSINSFILYRTIEYIKIDLCSMKQPVKIFGVGSGFSYPEDGPTHHSTEDISLIGSLPNIELYNPSDSVIMSHILKRVYKSKKPSVVRMDRQFCSQIYSGIDLKINDGFSEIIKSKKNCIITTGFFTSKIKKLINDKKINCGLIDFFEIKNYDEKFFAKKIKKYKNLITIEEHSLRFGIGSIISTIITDNNLNTKLCRMGLIEDKTFNYGTRDMLFKDNKLDDESIYKSILKNFS